MLLSAKSSIIYEATNNEPISRSEPLVPRGGLVNSNVLLHETKAPSTIDLLAHFPELYQCKHREEREKLVRKFHALQMLLSEYSFSTAATAQFSREYKIIGILGDGTFGFVMEGIHMPTKRPVAIKFISKLSTTSQQLGKDGVPREIELLSQCNHPNIIKYVNHFEDSNYWYLITERFGSQWKTSNRTEPPDPGSFLTFVPRDEQLKRFWRFTDVLRQHVEREITFQGPMDLFECIESHDRIPDLAMKKIIVQLLDVMRYLEEQLCCSHGDIKDENILIDSEYNIKLVDFGSVAFPRLGHHENDIDARSVNFMGTLQFAAPEVMLGQVYLGTVSDLWSVGSLLYLMVTRRNFVDRIVKMPTTSQFTKNRYAFELGDLQLLWKFTDDIELYDFLSGLLQPDPQQRTPLNRLFCHSWLQS